MCRKEAVEDDRKDDRGENKPNNTGKEEGRRRRIGLCVLLVSEDVMRRGKAEGERGNGREDDTQERRDGKAGDGGRIERKE